MKTIRPARRPLGCALFLLGSLAFVGCASPWINLESEEVSKVAADRARVMVVVPKPRVLLVERLDKVLWQETKLNSYSFDGIWDPAPWLEERIARALEDRWSIKAAPLRTSLDLQGHEAISASARSGILAAWKDKQGLAYIKSPAEESVRSIRQEGSEYLFQVYLIGVIVSRPTGPFASNSLVVDIAARLVRLSDGCVVWFHESKGSAPVPSIRSFSELEKDNLALLKECFEAAVASLLRPDGDFLANLGSQR